MKGIPRVNPDWGITVVRVMTGLLFAVHGYQKFARGLDEVSAYFAKISIPFPGVMVPFIATLELVGGACSSSVFSRAWSAPCSLSRCS